VNRRVVGLGIGNLPAWVHGSICRPLVCWAFLGLSVAFRNYDFNDADGGAEVTMVTVLFGGTFMVRSESGPKGRSGQDVAE
jgi:hypothetical protein